MMRNIFMLLFIILIGQLSCTGDNEQPNYFPISEGNWWEYQYSDSLTKSLKVSGIDTIDGNEVQRLLWIEAADTNIDFVLKKETEIILYTTHEPWSAFTLARLPLKEGNSWDAFIIVIGGDTTVITAYVEEKLDISVPAGEFSSCYPIYYENQTPGKPKRIYFAPWVGPVRYEYANSPTEELVDYEVE